MASPEAASIIDAHHHLWAPDTDPMGVGWTWLRRPGPRAFGDPGPIRRDYLLDEFRAEPAPSRLAGSVHVQSDNALPDPVRETRFVQALSDTASFPMAVVGFADLSRPDAAETLARHAAHQAFRGVRQILSRDDADPRRSYAARHHLRDGLWRERFGLLAAMGLSFDLQLLPAQMIEAARVLEEHPDVPVALDHLGSPETKGGDDGPWREGMAALAALPWVHVKLSGYGMTFGARPGERARRLTAEALRLFGPGRAMFGSNFPVDKLWLGYRQALDLVSACCPDLEARAAVLGGTARAFYRLPPQHGRGDHAAEHDRAASRTGI